MEITIKFDENDIATHTADVVEAILQATNMKYDAQNKAATKTEKQQKQENQKEQNKQEQQQNQKEQNKQEQQEYTLQYVRELANEKRKIVGRQRIIDLVNEKYGGQGVSGIKQCDYGAFLKDLEELQ
ncbi:hypothetical protein AAK894_13015 [Lachnospiraceae bacterium 46-61]